MYFLNELLMSLRSTFQVSRSHDDRWGATDLAIIFPHSLRELQNLNRLFTDQSEMLFHFREEPDQLKHKLEKNP